MMLMVAMKLLTAYHVEQAERVEEAGFGSFLLFVHLNYLVRFPSTNLG